MRWVEAERETRAQRQAASEKDLVERAEVIREDGTGIPPGGGTVTGVSTNYRGVLAIGPGTYTLSVTFVFDQSVNDGWDTYPAGTTLNGTCTFTVTA
jgi:hypothetical protein